LSQDDVTSGSDTLNKLLSSFDANSILTSFLKQ